MTATSSFSYNQYTSLKKKTIAEKENVISKAFFLSDARNYTGSLFHSIEKGNALALGKTADHAEIIQAFHIFEPSNGQEKGKISKGEEEKINIVKQALLNETFKNPFNHIQEHLDKYSMGTLNNSFHSASEIHENTANLFRNLIDTIKDKEKQKFAKTIFREMITNGIGFTNCIDAHMNEKNKYLQNYVISCEIFVNLLFENIVTPSENANARLIVKDLVTLCISSAGLLLTYEKKSFGQKFLLFAKQAFAPLALLFSTALDTITGHFLASVAIGTGIFASIVTPIVFAAGGFLAGLALIYGLHKLTNYCYEKSAGSIHKKNKLNIEKLSKSILKVDDLLLNQSKTPNVNLEKTKIQKEGDQEKTKQLYINTCVQSFTGLDNKSIEHETPVTNGVRNTISSISNQSQLSEIIPTQFKIPILRKGASRNHIKELKIKMDDLEKTVDSFFDQEDKPNWYNSIMIMRKDNKSKIKAQRFIEDISNKIQDKSGQEKFNELLYTAHNLGNVSDDMSPHTINEVFLRICNLASEISTIIIEKEFLHTEETTRNKLTLFLTTYLSSSALYLSYNKRNFSSKFFRYLFVGVIPCMDGTLECISIAMGDIFDQSLGQLGVGQIAIETLGNIGLSLPVIGIGLSIILWASRNAKKKDKTGIHAPNNYVISYVEKHLNSKREKYLLNLEVAESKLPPSENNSDVKQDETTITGDIGSIKSYLSKELNFFAIKVIKKDINKEGKTIYTVEKRKLKAIGERTEGEILYPFTQVGISIFKEEQQELQRIKTSPSLSKTREVSLTRSTSYSSLSSHSPISLESSRSMSQERENSKSLKRSKTFPEFNFQPHDQRAG